MDQEAGSQRPVELAVANYQQLIKRQLIYSVKMRKTKRMYAEGKVRKLIGEIIGSYCGFLVL